MFVFEVLIYGFFAFVMSYLAKNSLIKNPDGVELDRYLAFAIVFFAIVSGIRWGVGSDFFSYATQFDTGMAESNLENRSNEFIWVYFVQLFSASGLHYTIGMGFVAFIQILFIYLAFKEYKSILIYIPIVMFGGWFIMSLWGGMRQMIVACVFVYISRWIIERKLLKYIIAIWVLHYVHNSALLLIPLYFIPLKFHLSDKRKFCLIGFLTCFILGQTPIFSDLINIITNFAHLAGYNDYSEQIANKLSGEDVETRRLGPTMISYFIICLFSIIYSPILKQRFNSIPYFEIWYNYSFFFSCGFFLFCNVSHIFIRPFMYFMLFLMIIIAMLLQNYKEIGRKSSIEYVCLIFFIWLGLFWTVYRLSNSTEFNFITYKFFWNHSLYSLK